MSSPSIIGRSRADRGTNEPLERINRARVLGFLLAFSVIACATRMTAAVAPADRPKSDPTSKMFVSSVDGGEATIKIGETTTPLVARQTYPASGAIIRTGPGVTLRAVFSNGLAVELRSESRIEVKRFTQESFRPDRTDVDREPSVTKVELVLIRGSAVIATSTLVAGSQLAVQTPEAIVRVLSGTLTITAQTSLTQVSVMTGACSIYGNSDPNRFNLIQAGELAVARSTPANVARNMAVEVQKIPAAGMAKLTEESAGVLESKKTVYFEVASRDKPATAANVTALVAGNDAPTASPSNPFTGDTAAGGATTTQEIVAYPVVPVELPTQYTVSPAILPNR